MTLPLLLALALALVLFYWAWVAAPRGSRIQRESLLRAESQAWNAKFFPVDPSRMLGDWERTFILFDPDARKACIVVGGKSARTVDFGHFRTWCVFQRI